MAPACLARFAREVRLFATAAAAAACAMALAGSHGCATADPATGLPEGTVVRSTTRVAPGQTGLEVIRWQVEDDGTQVQDALAKHACPAAAGMDEQALRANGFIFWPVRTKDLDAVIRDMGGSHMDVRTWFGQATAWRELAASQCGTTLLEIDGVAREYPGSVARLMLRSWPLPMEDGTRIAVELVPQIVTGEAESSLLRNGDRLSGQVVTSCAAELELDSEVAWIVTCDPARQFELKAPGGSFDPPTIPQQPPPELPEADPTQPLPEAEREPVPQPELAPQPEPTPEPAPEPHPANEPAPEPPAAAPPAAAPPAAAPPAAAPPAAAPPAHHPSATPPAPRLQPPQAIPPRPRSSKPTDNPPMSPPAPPAQKLARALVLLAVAMQSEPPAPAQEGAKETAPPPQRTRIVPLGVQLLLASPEGAGVATRRSVLVLVPHLDGSPSPESVKPQPMKPN